MAKALALISAALVAALLAGPAEARPPRDETTILVKFAKPSSDDRAKVAEQGDQAVGETKTKTVIVKVKPGSSVDAKLAEYQARADVAYAEANFIANAALAAPADPSFSFQWALAKIRALDAWTAFPGSYAAADGPPIGIVDSGVEASHADLAGAVLTGSGASCLSGVCVAGPAGDDFGHGTHVAGIAAATADNLLGVAGLAYQTPVMPVKVLDSTGNGSFAGVANGIIWAVDHGARVVNLSLGSTAYSQTVCDAVSYGLGQGAVVIAAAGNNGLSTPFYPAACPGAVGVGATDANDAVAAFSDTGYPNVFVTAPGVGILSTYLGGTYRSDSGTSMAAPYVSALSELLLAQDSDRSVLDVKRILAASSDKAGTGSYGSDPYTLCAACSWNASYGYGRINAYRALTTATPAPAPDFDLSASPSSVTAPRGAKTLYNLSVAGMTGFTGMVSFSVSGLPSGVTAAFGPASVSGSGSSTLAVTVSTSAPYGTYPLAVAGTSGSLSHTAQITLVVPAPDFALGASPSSASIFQAEKSLHTISLGNLYGFAGTVSLSVSGLPTGTTAAFSSTSISGTKTVTLTVTTTSSTPAGTYVLTVKGTSGSLVHTAPITLSVAVPVPGFSLTISPTSSKVTYGRATTITYKIGVVPKFGFKGTVAFTVAGIPAGTSGAFTASSINVSSTSTVYASYKLTVPAGTAKGSSTITFTATGGSLTSTIASVLTIS